MSEFEAPEVRVGQKTQRTMLHLMEKMSLEIGDHRRVAWIDKVLVEYELDPQRGFWRWSTVVATGHYGDGEDAVKIWSYGDAGIPVWAVLLIYKHVPATRRVR